MFKDSDQSVVLYGYDSISLVTEMCVFVSQTSTSVCWDPVTVGVESVASTPRAHSAALERSAVGPATSSLKATTAKVGCIVLFSQYFSLVFV